MATLALARADLVQEVAYDVGWGRTLWASLNAGQQAAIASIINRGLRQFYFHVMLPGEKTRHVWSFLRPRTTIDCWATESSTASGAPVNVAGISTVTAAAAMFFPSMVGHSIVFTATGNSYVITTYTSTTVVKVSGDASGEADGDTMTVTADGVYLMPSGFGGFVGNLTYVETDSVSRVVQVIGEGPLRALRQRSTSASSRPKYAAVRPQSCDGSAAQKFDLVVYPTPDSNYVLAFQYNVLPDALVDTTNEYPYGAMQHSEAILASCLAIAEQDMNDERGIKYADWIEKLASAVQLDRAANSPAYYGYNADRSSVRDEMGVPRVYGVTYNDVQY